MLATFTRWTRPKWRSFGLYPDFKIARTISLSWEKKIGTVLLKTDYKNVCKFMTSENNAEAMEIISASGIDLATDVCFRLFHITGNADWPIPMWATIPEELREV